MDLGHEGREAGLYVLELALVLPIALGGEVDNAAGAGELRILDDEHPAWDDFAPRAGLLVLLEVVRIGALELEGDPSAHDANAVHRVDEGFSVAGEDIASSNPQHLCCSRTQ